jgi:hypothetical protein
LALAARAIEDSADDKAAIERVFQLAYGRGPNADELRESLAFWAKATERQAKIKYEPRRWPIEITRRVIDEQSGKPVTFKERLVTYEDYVPDLAPHEVDARTRALADLCLAILNSNEFVFVD